MGHCKRNSLKISCPVRLSTRYQGRINRLIDCCRAVALWHRHHTFNRRAPSCSRAISRVTQRGPASTIIHYAQTSSPENGLIIRTVSANDEFKNSVSPEPIFRNRTRPLNMDPSRRQQQDQHRHGTSNNPNSQQTPQQQQGERNCSTEVLPLTLPTCSHSALVPRSTGTGLPRRRRGLICGWPTSWHFE